jgi:hypothetical protein
VSAGSARTKVVSAKRRRMPAKSENTSQAKEKPVEFMSKE